MATAELPRVGPASSSQNCRGLTWKSATNPFTSPQKATGCQVASAWEELLCPGRRTGGHTVRTPPCRRPRPQPSHRGPRTSPSHTLSNPCPFQAKRQLPRWLHPDSGSRMATWQCPPTPGPQPKLPAPEPWSFPRCQRPASPASTTLTASPGKLLIKGTS